MPCWFFWQRLCARPNRWNRRCTAILQQHLGCLVCIKVYHRTGRHGRHDWRKPAQSPGQGTRESLQVGNLCRRRRKGWIKVDCTDERGRICRSRLELSCTGDRTCTCDKLLAGSHWQCKRRRKSASRLHKLAFAFDKVDESRLFRVVPRVVSSHRKL